MLRVSISASTGFAQVCRQRVFSHRVSTVSVFASLCFLALAVLLMPTPAAAQPTVATEQVATGFVAGIGATSANDGSGRIFVVEQGGTIRIWDGSQVLATPLLDIDTLISTGGERGLLGLAFHPDHASNGFFYVNYTDLLGDTVIARYTVMAGNPNVADPASALIILTFDQPFENHNGGDLHFGPDDLLYISSGDGGDFATSQDDANLLGKILRIDVDGDDFPSDPERNYAIPPDNPLVGVSGAREEIWNLGLRNPWRFSFDRLTGDLFIADVGEDEWEEINFEAAGAPFADRNYGWSCYEGDDVFLGCGAPEDFTFPIINLPHDPPPDNNCSVIGGFRYRGTVFPSFEGWYFYTDWCTGILWVANESGGVWTSHQVLNLGGFSFTGFAEGDDGELYLAGSFELLRLVDPNNGIFSDGFESGDTAEWSSSNP